MKIPGQPSDYSEGMLKSLLTLADVMPTGYHAARVANVQKGDKVVVIGDGAVGQCAVIAAKMRGASQIVLMSRHEDRQKMALESGATAVVAERGEEGIAKVREILGGGADAWVQKQLFSKLYAYFIIGDEWELSVYLTTIIVPLVQPLPKISQWQVEQPQLLLMTNKFC